MLQKYKVNGEEGNYGGGKGERTDDYPVFGWVFGEGLYLKKRENKTFVIALEQKEGLIYRGDS